MTEEIIIDGVNVAGCKNYVHIEEERYKPECNCRLTTVERGYYCDTYATSVCEEEDCEYKQLKRLEQENRELRKANEISIEKVTITAEAKRLQELEQENKELKIYIESNKQQVEEAEMLVMDNDRLQQEVENLKDIIYYDVEKYRSALEEIRKLIKSYDLTVDNGASVDTIYKIRKIINEVLNEKEL